MSNQTDCRRRWRPKLYPKSAAVLAAAEEIRKQKQKDLLSDSEIYDDTVVLKCTDEDVYDDIVLLKCTDEDEDVYDDVIVSATHAKFVDTNTRPMEPARLQSQSPERGNSATSDSNEDVYDDIVVQKPDITTPQTCGSAATKPQPAQKPSHLHKMARSPPLQGNRDSNLGSCFAREGQLQPELDLCGAAWINGVLTEVQEIQNGFQAGAIAPVDHEGSGTPFYPSEHLYDTDCEATAVAASMWATTPTVPFGQHHNNKQHLLVRDAIRDPLPAAPLSCEDPFEIQTWDSEEEEEEPHEELPLLEDITPLQDEGAPLQDEGAYEEETSVVIKALSLPTAIRDRATRITPHERKKLKRKLQTLRERSQTLPSGYVRYKPTAEQILEDQKADAKDASPPIDRRESSDENSGDEVIPFGKSRVVFEMLLDASGIERVPSRCLHASNNETAITPEESDAQQEIEHEEHTEGAAMSTEVTQYCTSPKLSNATKEMTLDQQ